MLTVPEALERILALMAPTGAVTVPLRAAAGRVLAAPVAATRDQPPFPASAMDGWAVRAADAGPGATLRVTGAAVAGRRFPGRVGPGEAVRIFTGAPVPPGADTILIQEDAEAGLGAVTVRAAPGPGQHIRPAGGDFAAGAALAPGRRIGPGLLVQLAAMNLAEVPVARPPVVAIIPTGDELVWPGEAPGEDQIPASSGFGLAALLEAEGALPRLLPIARDTAASLRAALALAEGADLIVTLGGASVGEHDLVRQVFTEEGLELAFWKIALRPGKPLIAGRIRGVPMIGLPGNPVSTMVCGHVFLRPAIRALLGLKAGPLPRETGVLGVPEGPNGPREHYMRARLEGTTLVPFAAQDSSLVSVFAAADALLVRAAGAPALPAGAEVEFIRL